MAFSTSGGHFYLNCKEGRRRTPTTKNLEDENAAVDTFIEKRLRRCFLILYLDHLWADMLSQLWTDHFNTFSVAF